jgi:ubiquinol-cytochrome c reductase core subunit 2
MLSRSTLSRGAQAALKHQCTAPAVARRGYAAVSTGNFQYQVGDAGGVKIASRDLAGPITTLAVVAKAGTRYQLLPGFADGLDQFAFKVSEVFVDG